MGRSSNRGLLCGATWYRTYPDATDSELLIYSSSVSTWIGDREPLSRRNRLLRYVPKSARWIIGHYAQ